MADAGWLSSTQKLLSSSTNMDMLQWLTTRMEIHSLNYPLGANASKQLIIAEYKGQLVLISLTSTSWAFQIPTPHFKSHPREFSEENDLILDTTKNPDMSS